MDPPIILPASIEATTLGCLEKLEFLFEDKAGEHYNRRNINHILRITM